MRWQGVAYRAHDPQWAWAPTSGGGAAATGGRFNLVGMPALNLALTVEGMLLETAHGLAHRFDPLTICSYDVDAEDLTDLRTEAGCAAAGVAPAVLACAWRYDRANGHIPASWTMARALTAQGVAGIFVPSFARGARKDMSNLVLWHWGDTPSQRVTVFDPAARLSRDRSSWRAEGDEHVRPSEAEHMLTARRASQ